MFCETLQRQMLEQAFTRGGASDMKPHDTTLKKAAATSPFRLDRIPYHERQNSGNSRNPGRNTYRMSSEYNHHFLMDISLSRNILLTSVANIYGTR